MNEIEKHKREFNHSLIGENREEIRKLTEAFENGFQGEQGPPGPQGPPGLQGPQGEKGDPGEDATTLRIDSSRGILFKNNAVSTVLSAVIYKGSKRITDITALREEFGDSAHLEWLWQRLNEETFGTILATDSRIGNDGFTFTLSPNDVDTKVVFMCQLITD